MLLELLKVKLVFAIALLFIASSSLFAFNAGDKIIYPTVGMGISVGNSTALYGENLGTIYGNSAYWNNADLETSIAFSVGAAFDYFITDRIALTTGLTYNYFPYQIIWPKKDAIDDAKYRIYFDYLILPLGVRGYFNYFLVGGGLFYALNLTSDFENQNPYDTSNKGSIKEAKNLFGFFIDLGLNYELSETKNLQLYIKLIQSITNTNGDNSDILKNIKQRVYTINIAYGVKI